MQNIDKISIAFAALVFVGSLGFIVFGSDEGSASIGKIEDYKQKIDANIASQEIRIPDYEDVAGGVAAQFQGFDANATGPAWAFYRRPASFGIDAYVERQPPTHIAPRLTKVRSDRDEKGGVLEVWRVPSKTMHAKIEKSVLRYRESGSEGPWDEMNIPVPASANDSEAPIVIHGVKPGTQYDVQVGSKATSTSAIGFDAKDATGKAEETSATVTSAPVPYDRDIRLVSGTTASLETGDPGNVLITVDSWNREKRKVKSVRVRCTEAVTTAVCDSAEHPFIAGTEWKLLRIERDAKGKLKAILRNPKTRDKLILIEGAEPAQLEPIEVAGEEPEPTGESGDATPADGDDANKAEKAKKKDDDNPFGN